MSLPCFSPPIDFNPEPQNRLTNLLGLDGRDFVHSGVANRAELLTKIVWEICRLEGNHFQKRTLDPVQNRSVVCCKMESG